MNNKQTIGTIGIIFVALLTMTMSVSANTNMHQPITSIKIFTGDNMMLTDGNTMFALRAGALFQPNVMVGMTVPVEGGMILHMSSSQLRREEVEFAMFTSGMFTRTGMVILNIGRFCCHPVYLNSATQLLVDPIKGTIYLKNSDGVDIANGTGKVSITNPPQTPTPNPNA